MLLIAIFGWLVAPYSYSSQDLYSILQPPSSKYWLGTDQLGRDLLSRILYGTGISMLVAVVTSLTALTFGTTYGAISGYVGGRADSVMMRFVDVVYSFPDLLLIIFLTVVMGRGMPAIVVALSLVSWVSIARLIRGEVLRIKEQEFIEAARALGASHSSIIYRHILPSTIGPLIVTLTFRIPAVILAESTLSFIGLGVEPPKPSWGSLAREGWALIRFNPHMIVFPALSITLTMLAFNFLGDGLRDALDPRRISAEKV
jgi:oligopeptide transport system permease protein